MNLALQWIHLLFTEISWLQWNCDSHTSIVENIITEGKEAENTEIFKITQELKWKSGATDVLEGWMLIWSFSFKSSSIYTRKPGGKYNDELPTAVYKTLWGLCHNLELHFIQWYWRSCQNRLNYERWNVPSATGDCTVRYWRSCQNGWNYEHWNVCQILHLHALPSGKRLVANRFLFQHKNDVNTVNDYLNKNKRMMAHEWPRDCTSKLWKQCAIILIENAMNSS